MLGGTGRPHEAQDMIQRKIVAIARGRGLLPMSLSPRPHAWIGRKDIIAEETKAHPPRNMGNDVMSKALHQISKSPFTRRIDKAKLPHCFA